MDLKKDYQELYKRWLKEINDKEISNFSQEEYMRMRDLLKNIKDLIPLRFNSLRLIKKISLS